uniref:Uncharacterized protein n=1 Tax=Desertifilum tharense IPPAS B-1220 TaxID=1781255 RepID=A0ACD5GV89_9CYAN
MLSAEWGKKGVGNWELGVGGRRELGVGGWGKEDGGMGGRKDRKT